MTAWVALSIGCLSLAFTLFSFWWLQVRCGRLVVPKPRSMAACGAQDKNLVLQIPLVFFNSGAAARVVRNLRVRIGPEEEGPALTFVCTIKKLGTSEDREWARQFAVLGRSTADLICQFQREPGHLEFTSRGYELALDGLLDDSECWMTLCSFEFLVKPNYLPQINECVLAYDLEVS